MSTVLTIPEGAPVEMLIAGLLALEAEFGCELALGPGLPLGKAVPVHHSHFQERSLSGQFGAPPETPSPLLPAEDREAAWERAEELETEELSPRLARHLADFTAGHLSGEEWERRVLGDLKLFYGELYRSGKQAAGWAGVKLTPQDQALLGRLVRDEADYLARFRSDLEQGKGVLPYPARMQLYANAAREALWSGFVLGDLSPKRELRWSLGPTEHCADCLGFAELGWLPAFAFLEQVLKRGYAPQSGALECKGVRCRCRLLDRLGP